MSDDGYGYFSGKRKTKNDKKKQRGHNKYKRGGQFRTREITNNSNSDSAC